MLRLLTIKHWQLFCFLFIIPVFAMILFMLFVMDTNNYSTFAYMIPILTILMVGPLLTWLYSTGTELQEKLPADIQMPVNKFRFLLFFAGGYFFFITYFMTNHADVFGSCSSFNYWPAVIVPLHLISTFGMFYSIYFVAKSLRSVELKRTVTFGDCFGEFLMLWFYPLGVWVIQPRINNIFDESRREGNDHILDRNL